MLYSSYYNEENQILIIASSKQANKQVEENGDVYFYDEEGQMVGANLKMIGLRPGLVDLHSINDPRIGQFCNDQYPFKYGEILSVEKHPNSDHLHICQIDDGEIKQIVCGAKNVCANKIALVAQVGAVMPNGNSIIPSQLLKVDSTGMLCSLYELGLEDSSNGIFLSDNLSLKGQPFKG